MFYKKKPKRIPSVRVSENNQNYAINQFGAFINMIPEDILKADHCIHDLDELTLKLHNYLTNNPGKPAPLPGR